MFTPECPLTNIVCTVCIRTATRGNCEQLHANNAPTYARTNLHAHGRVCVYLCIAKGFAGKTRMHRRMLSIFFSLPFLSPAISSFGKFNADGLRDFSVSRSRETNGGGTGLFVYDKQKYRPEFVGCNVTYEHGLNCL